MYHFKVLLNITHLQWPFLLLCLFSSCITPYGVSVSLESLEKKMRLGTGLSAHLSGKRQHAADYLGRFFRISTSGWANVLHMPGLQGVLYMLYRTGIDDGSCRKFAKSTKKIFILLTFSPDTQYFSFSRRLYRQRPGKSNQHYKSVKISLCEGI